MAEILSMISLISFIVSGISFVLAVVCWFYLKIPSVIGDLTGSTARKSISKMRLNNQKTGNKSYRPSTENVQRGKITSNMAATGKVNKDTSNELKDEMKSGFRETGILSTNKADLGKIDVATGLLNENIETELLEENQSVEVQKHMRRKENQNIRRYNDYTYR